MAKHYQVESTMCLEREGKEIDIQIKGIFIPGCRAVWYLSNGDPGYPAEPAEIDDLQAFDGDKLIKLDDEEIEKAINTLLECEHETGPDPDDSRDDEWDRQIREEEYDRFEGKKGIDY